MICHCIIFHCIISYHIISYHFILYYNILYYTILYYIVLSYIILCLMTYLFIYSCIDLFMYSFKYLFYSIIYFILNLFFDFQRRQDVLPSESPFKVKWLNTVSGNTGTVSDTWSVFSIVVLSERDSQVVGDDNP